MDPLELCALPDGGLQAIARVFGSPWIFADDELFWVMTGLIYGRAVVERRALVSVVAWRVAVPLWVCTLQLTLHTALPSATLDAG